MARSTIVILICILSILSFSFAKFTSAEMEVNMEWDVIAEGHITYANLSLSIPSNTTNQEVISIQISEPYTLEKNGEVWKAVIELENFSEKIIRGKFTIETDYIKKTNIMDDPSNYLNRSELVDINDPITSIASRFSQLPFPNNTISLLGWVHENIVYDKTFTASSYPASSVLKSKRGVCDEYSHLFIAMCRSIGVPARIVIGYSYSADSWGPHAWTEVYDKNWGWTEVDPTDGDFLNLDALRIRTATGVDQEDTRDQISALGSTEDINLTSSVSVEVIKKSEESNVAIDLELNTEPENSTHQPVVIKVRNRNLNPIFLTASLIVPQGTETNCSSNLLLQSGEEKAMNCDVDLDLVPNMRYNYTIQAHTDYGVAETSFERVIVEEEYSSIKELPQSFMVFIAIAVAIAIVLIIVAVKIEW